MFRYLLLNCALAFCLVAVQGSSRDPCQSRPCQNGGQCSPFGTQFVTCRCPPRYLGHYCQTPNPCNSNPCQNNGSCYGFTIYGYSKLAEFTCHCPAGFKGRLCENKDRSHKRR